MFSKKLGLVSKELGRCEKIIGTSYHNNWDKNKNKKRVNYAVKETLDLEIHVQIHSSVSLLQILLAIAFLFFKSKD